MIVPVDTDALDGRVGVGVVTGQCGWGLADAYDELVRDGVELDATAVERLGFALREFLVVGFMTDGVAGSWRRFEVL